MLITVNKDNTPTLSDAIGSTTYQIISDKLNAERVITNSLTKEIIGKLNDKINNVNKPTVKRVVFLLLFFLLLLPIPKSNEVLSNAIAKLIVLLIFGNLQEDTF
jgi:membrane-anchored glycerophosphoryl diester phosphodiesterase (GDPDase)